MWGTRLKGRRPSKNSELYYATHYHLVPLYVLSGILLIGMLLMACYVRFLWASQQNSDFQHLGEMTARSTDNLFLPAVPNVADKKQYVYPVNIRFTSTDPYQELRYSYDPGSSNDKDGAAIGITTTRLLQNLEAPLQNVGPSNFNLVTQLQECSKLYVLRFEPGSTQYGGFTPFAQIALKDGRTAYIHKNTNCIPEADDGGGDVVSLEAMLKTVESY